MIRPRRSPDGAGSYRTHSPMNTLKPWRQVATPHADIRSGKFDASVFAADLGEVLAGRGAADYRDAATFFGKTYLTRRHLQAADRRDAAALGHGQVRARHPAPDRLRRRQDPHPTDALPPAEEPGSGRQVAADPGSGQCGRAPAGPRRQGRLPGWHRHEPHVEPDLLGGDGLPVGRRPGLCQGRPPRRAEDRRRARTCSATCWRRSAPASSCSTRSSST